MRGRIAGLCVAVAMLATSAGCHPPHPPAHGRPTYDLTFAGDVPADRFAARFPGLATWPYFGGEAEARRKGLPLNPTMQFYSRTWPGILDVYVDPGSCQGTATPAVRNGALVLTAFRFSPLQAISCGHGSRPWGSAIVTSQPGFAQTYGTWEIEAKLPCSPGRWPAFWLLPVAKTPENGGRLAEIDVFEHYGGPVTLHSHGTSVTVDRVGRPFSTLHYGTKQHEQQASNAKQLPPVSDADRAAFCGAWHRFAVTWTRASFRFFIDGTETFETPNPGVDDPHYWVLNLDVSPTAGDPDADPNPSEYQIRYVRVWAR